MLDVVGYNTDVQYDGGVAIGSNSVSSVDKGALGYNPVTGKAFDSEAAIVAFTGKGAELDELNTKIPSLETALSDAKTNYDSKVSDYLARMPTMFKPYMLIMVLTMIRIKGKRIKEQMDAAKGCQ